MISKRGDRPHDPGRSGAWLKTKCVMRQEFVIGGFTDPAVGRVGLGALLVGVYENGQLKYAGKVGTGFNDATLTALRERLRSLEQKAPAFQNPPRGAAYRDAHWVTPNLVAEVAFTEWTSEGTLRHSSFQGLREDKRPEAIVREQAV